MADPKKIIERLRERNRRIRGVKKKKRKTPPKIRKMKKS